MVLAESKHQRADVAQAASSTQPSGPRIAYLLSQYPARSHTFLLQEVVGLRARGFHIEVASINAPDRAVSSLSATEADEAFKTFYVKRGNGIRVALVAVAIALRRPATVARGLRAIICLPSSKLNQRAFWLFYLAEALLLGRWMQQQALRHLHVHFGGAVAAVGMLTSVMWQVSYSLTIHGPEELIRPREYQLPSKLVQARFVICISDFCKASLQQTLPIGDWSKLSVIRLGIDPAYLQPNRSRIAKSNGSFSIVCVGRLVPEKGHRVLLSAFRVLLDRGLHSRLLLIGTGPLESELRDYAAELGLQAQVTFTSGLGHEEALAHVREADLFVLASYAEGIPVALMEAMALEVPCVSTSVAGIPELIHSNRDGLLVTPGDVPALADALALLATNETLRKKIGAAGRSTVLEGFNLPRNLDTLAAHFREHLCGDATPAMPLTASEATTRA